MSRVVKLAVIPGDGIGPEVVTEAVKVLDAVTAAIEVPQTALAIATRSSKDFSRCESRIR